MAQPGLLPGVEKLKARSIIQASNLTFVIIGSMTPIDEQAVAQKEQILIAAASPQILHSKEEAYSFLDVKSRKMWQHFMNQLPGDNPHPSLGKLEILSETAEDGRFAWTYHFEGMPMSPDMRTEWLLDTGHSVRVHIHPPHDSEQGYADSIEDVLRQINIQEL